MDKEGMEFAIFDAELNMAKRLNDHKIVCVSVSGGSDSDIIVHMICTKFREYLPKIHFVFSNTGIEYRATLQHLDYLEKRYGINIDRIRGMPIPLCVKKYGVPFVSKQVSEFISRLQSHGFTWIEGTIDELQEKFERCRAALRWWCNDWGTKKEGFSRFNINWNKGLKEGLEKNNPEFKISAICCQKSKKEPLTKYRKSIGADLLITGERKSEGGARAGKHGCFEHTHGIDHHMPLFWWDDETKAYYKKQEGIRYSDCYEIYGLKRTGCVGCPFALNVSEELAIMKKHEPQLYRLCVSVFGKSYLLMDKLKMRKNTILEDLENDDRA